MTRVHYRIILIKNIFPYLNLQIFSNTTINHGSKHAKEVAEGHGKGVNSFERFIIMFNKNIPNTQAKKQSTSGSGVDAANVMLSQLRAQKAVKKKSVVSSPSPGN